MYPTLGVPVPVQATKSVDLCVIYPALKLLSYIVRYVRIPHIGLLLSQLTIEKFTSLPADRLTCRPVYLQTSLPAD